MVCEEAEDTGCSRARSVPALPDARGSFCLAVGCWLIIAGIERAGLDFVGGFHLRFYCAGHISTASLR